MPEKRERNLFYLLLLVCSLVFVVTALAVALVPALEDKAREAGNPPPPSEFRAQLRSDGWLWLLYEAGAVILFAALSMGYDRLRRLKTEREEKGAEKRGVGRGFPASRERC